VAPQSNGPLYSNTVIGTLDVAACWVGCYMWYNEEGPGQAAAPPSPLLAVPDVTAHPSTASVPTSYYSIWRHNCLCTVNGWTIEIILATSQLHLGYISWAKWCTTFVWQLRVVFEQSAKFLRDAYFSGTPCRPMSQRCAACAACINKSIEIVAIYQ